MPRRPTFVVSQATQRVREARVDPGREPTTCLGVARGQTAPLHQRGGVRAAGRASGAGAEWGSRFLDETPFNRLVVFAGE